MLGAGVVQFLKNPDQLAKFRASPDLHDNAMDEILRVEPPVTQVLRSAHQDMQVADKAVKQGDTIHMSLFGVHFDPEMNPDPLKFDIERKNIQHFAFGGGAHYCLGAGLGKAQAKIALPMLLERFPNLALAPRPRGETQNRACVQWLWRDLAGKVNSSARPEKMSRKLG